jgi:hypothetical protein
VNGVELLLQEPFSFGAEQGEVVEAAGWRRNSRDGVRFDVWVDSGDNALGFSDLKEGVVVPDLDAGEIERVIAKFNGLTAQVGGDAVAVSTEGKSGGLGDFAMVAMEKGLTEFLRVGGTGGRGWVLAEPFEGRLTSLSVEFAMIDDLDPGQERLVQLVQGGDRRVSEFGQKIGLDELEEAFDLPAAFGIVRSTEDALDAQAST